MRNTKRRHRWLALALCLCLLASVFPLSGMTYAAAETGCNHVHDKDCGYIAAAGAPCTFRHTPHDDTCGYAEAKDASPCSVEAAHIHDDTCGFVKAVAGAPCTHVHDADCGGLAQDSGSVPCTKTEGCKLPDGHEGDCDAPILLTANAEYHPGDVAVINGIIDRSTLGWTKNDPGSWNTTILSKPYLKWDDSTPKRIKELRIFSAGLTGTLDVSGLTNLQYLYCSDNPFQSLKLPGGETLTVNVSPENSGTVMFRHNQNLIDNKSITLTATPETGHTFTGWTGDKSGSDAKNSFTLDGNKSVTATFSLDPAATILEVPFNDNGSGGTSLTDNEMKTAVEAALGSGDKTKFTTIRLTGSATEITGQNWRYLLELYRSVSGWTNLTTLDLSSMSGLKKVGDEASSSFVYFVKLTTVHFPDSLQTIGDYAFSYCTNLTGVTLPDSLQTIGNWAFAHCVSLTSLALPKELQTIGDYAFTYCTGLTSMTFPASLQIIGYSAFYSCNGLTAFSVDPDNPAFASVDGVLYDKDKKTLIQYPRAKSGTSFTMPNTVRSITDYAFYYCNSLTSVTFPASLQTIGDKAFFLCGGLNSMTFLGETAPSLNTQTFGNGVGKVPANGTLYHPANAAAYASGTFGSPVLDDWERRALSLYTLTVNGGSDKTGGGLYTEGAQVQIIADVAPSGKTFDKWTTSGGGSFADKNSASTTFTMPAADVTVTANYKDSGGSDPTPSTYSLTVQAETGGKITQGASGNYAQGASITLKAEANANYAFDGWTTSGGGSFADQNSAATTFTMPGNATIVTANFRYTGGGSDPDPGPSYTWRALTDPSGVRVSGLFTSDAKLEVKEMLLHPAETCDVCDNIRQRQKNGELIVLFDIGLKSGKYKGDLDVEIPVGGQYNGQSIVIIHCKDKVMDSRTVTVENGMAKGAFSSLSPYAAAKVPGKTVITGLPESYTLLVGQSVSWTPSPAGGAWSYDTDLLEMTRQGDTYTFKALKEGKAAATYTVDGVPFTVTIAVNASTIPQTGDTTSTLPWALLATAALLGCAALVIGRKGGYKKRHG